MSFGIFFLAIRFLKCLVDVFCLAFLNVHWLTLLNLRLIFRVFHIVLALIMNYCFSFLDLCLLNDLRHFPFLFVLLLSFVHPSNKIIVDLQLFGILNQDFGDNLR